MAEIQELKNCSQDADWYKVEICDLDSQRRGILQYIRQFFRSNHSELTFVHFQNDCVCFKQTCEFSQERLRLYNELNNYSNVYSNFIIHGDKFLYVPDDEWKSFGNIFPKHKEIMLLYSCLEQGKKLMTNEQKSDFESPEQVVSLPSYQTWDKSCHDPQYNLNSCTFVDCLNDDDMAASPTNKAKYTDRALRSTKIAIGGGMAPIKVKKAQYESIVLMLTKMAKMMLTRIVPHENMDIICTSLNITDIVLSVIKGQLFIKTAKGEKMKWKLSNNDQSVNMMLLSRKSETVSHNTLMLTGNDQEVSLPNRPNEVGSLSRILLDGPEANRHIQKPEKNIERSLINREDHVSVVEHSVPKVKKSRKAVSKKYGFRVKIKHALCGSGKGKCTKERCVLGEQNKYLNKMPLRNRFLKKRDKWKKKHRIDTRTQCKRLKPLKQQKGWSWNYYENLKLKYLKDEEYDLNQVQKEHIMDISQYIREFTRLPSGEHYSSNIDVWPASRENRRNEDTADHATNHVQNQLEQSGREREPHSIEIQHPSRELEGVYRTQQLGDQIQENSRIGIRTQESNIDAAASDLPMPNLNTDQLSTQESNPDAAASDLPIPDIIRHSPSQATRSSSETFAYGELGIRERLPHQRLDMPLSKAWKKAKARRAILVTREQTLAGDPDVVPVISPVIIPADRAPSAPVIGPVIVPADMVAGATDVGPVNLTAFRAQKAPDISLVSARAFRALASPSISTANTKQNSNKTNAIYSEMEQILSQNSNLNQRICNTSSAIEKEQSKLVNKSYESYCTGMPFSCLSLVFGSFSQANNRFSIQTRGSQCTINSLCALIYSKYSDLITTENIDEVLNIGDELYRNVVNNLKQLGRFKHRLLSLDEMPDQVNVLSKVVQIRKGNIVSGLTIQHFGDTDLPTLHQALYATFQRANHALVMIGSICSAVFLKDEEFWLFDSHSHGEYGLSDVDGKSVLMSFHKLENLVTFMYAMYESANIDIMSQYEILPLNFNVVQCTSQYHNMYINNQQKITDISKTDADDVWQTVSYKKQKKSTYFSVMPRDEQLCEVVKKNIKQQSIDHKVKERTYSYPAVGLKTKVKNDTILIGKYFKHQYQKQQQKNKEGESDRKAYMRLYMQKRLQSDQFKVKDKEFTLKSKRKARSDEAFKQKEIQIQNKSKKKARSDPLILEQEKIAKQESRKCPKYKHKELQIQNKSKQKARSDPLILEQEKKAKQESRKCPEYKHKKMQIQNKSKQKARTDKAFKQKEIQVQNKSKKRHGQIHLF